MMFKIYSFLDTIRDTFDIFDNESVFGLRRFAWSVIFLRNEHGVIFLLIFRFLYKIL